jgi:hypothetical protein
MRLRSQHTPDPPARSVLATGNHYAFDVATGPLVTAAGRWTSQRPLRRRSRALLPVFEGGSP